MRTEKVVALTGISFISLLAAGCGGFSSAGGTPVAPSVAVLQGKVFGGQQPVVGAAIQLYQAGATGYGAGATSLLTVPVLTGPGGTFSITGDYSCTTGRQVYITATGGNPGGGINNSLALIAGLGDCANLASGITININEVTTVATVWSLSRFASDLNIGTSATNNAGLIAAFSDISTIVDIATGTSPGTTTPSGATVPTAEIDTLANILASCVNSTGAGDGGPCDKLFANATSTAGAVPADTVAAAENMAIQPGKNVSILLALATPTGPFEPTLTSLNDFTVGIVFTGNGLSAPSGVAIDSNSNVWISNFGGDSVSEFSHTGIPLFSVGSTTMNEPSSLAIDLNGNVWISNHGNSELSELSSTGESVGGSPYSGGGLSSPTSVAIDDLGNAWVANAGTSLLSAFSPSGVALSPSGGFATGLSNAIGVAINPR